MPGGDRKGPNGYGTKTGRCAGYCAGYGSPGYANVEFGRGRGREGGGRGWRNIFFATGLPHWARGYPVNPIWGMNGTQQYQYQGEITPESEIAALKAEAGIFQKQIDVLNERIRELEEIAARKEG